MTAWYLRVNPGWTWYEMAGGDEAPIPLQTSLSVAQHTTVMRVDGRAFLTADDGTNGTLVETTSAGGPHAGLVVPGYIWNACVSVE